jgi:hypothetical protein
MVLYMEKKKSLCFLLLSITLVLVGVQIASVAGTITQEFITNQNSFLPEEPNYLTVNDVFIDTPGPMEDPVWFFVNLSVVFVLTPLLFILPNVLIKDKEEDDIDPKTAVETELRTITRIGWLTLFIQNILILVTYILFFVLIPIYSDANTPRRVLQTYFILFDVDFIAAALLIAGLIILALKLPKQKPTAYIAAAFWFIFIGTAIYPRISLVTDFTGGLTATFQIDNLEDFLLNYTGLFIFLQTMGHCFFALAIFYTTKFLYANSQIKGKGLVNAFGIINYAVGGLSTVIISVIVTYGNQIQESAGFSLMILYVILFGLKFGAIPIIGIIAGIVAFNHMKPQVA